MEQQTLPFVVHNYDRYTHKDLQQYAEDCLSQLAWDFYTKDKLRIVDIEFDCVDIESSNRGLVMRMQATFEAEPKILMLLQLDGGIFA